MNIIKNEKNNVCRKITEINTGLSKKQLLELTDAVEYFSANLQASQKKLRLEEKRKILRMLIQEIQTRKGDITINHIIPAPKKIPIDQIARLHTDCESA